MQVSAVNLSPVSKIRPSFTANSDSYTQEFDFHEGDEGYLPDESYKEKQTYSGDMVQIEGALNDVKKTATKAANETDKKTPLMTALSAATIGAATFTAAQKGQAALLEKNNKIIAFLSGNIGKGLNYLNNLAQSSSKLPTAAKEIVGKITPNKVISALVTGGVLKEAFEDRNGNGIPAVGDTKEHVGLNMARQVAGLVDALG